jgi:phenylacetate-coenzyme A ligase PaaK-like adenylate-forming protein
MMLLNYKIGDWAKCVEKDEESGVVTVISGIRRETAYLAGAKLNPQEVEAIIDGLGEVKGFSGEYCIITYNDADRRAVTEVRLEARKQLSNEQKEQITQKVRQKIYSVNFPVMDICENVKDGKLIISITEPRQLYKGYEQHVKPGKPKRPITLG